MGQQSWLDSQLYQGALESPGARAYLRDIRDIAENNIDSLNNTEVSTGKTVENSLAAKDALNSSVNGAVSGLLQNEEARKINYFRMRQDVSDNLAKNRAEQAQNWMTLANNIATTSDNLGELYVEDGLSNGLFRNGAEQQTVSTPKSLADTSTEEATRLQQSELDSSIKKNVVSKKPADIMDNVALDATRENNEMATDMLSEWERNNKRTW